MNNALVIQEILYLFNLKSHQEAIIITLFTIFNIQKIGHLAYKLNISAKYKIYLVLSITQLEPDPSFTSNLFNQSCSTNLSTIFVNDNTDILKFFDIEQFLNKHTI